MGLFAQYGEVWEAVDPKSCLFDDRFLYVGPSLPETEELDEMMQVYSDWNGEMCVARHGFTLTCQSNGMFSYDKRDAETVQTAMNNMTETGMLMHSSMFTKCKYVMRATSAEESVYWNVWRWAHGYGLYIMNVNVMNVNVMNVNVMNTKNIAVSHTEDFRRLFDELCHLGFIRSLGRIYGQVRLLHGRFRDEQPEQFMSCMYIQPDDVVLEIGGNIGRNSLVISSIVSDPRKQLVVLETSPAIAKQLSQNSAHNRKPFQIVCAALSKQRLIQKGWNTRQMRPSEKKVPKGYTPVRTTSFDRISSLTPPFTVLVADCEGALYYILQEFPEMLTSLRTVIMENDFLDITHKEHVDSVLSKNGFRRVYYRAGGWGPCYDRFFEVWQKPGLDTLSLRNKMSVSNVSNVSNSRPLYVSLTSISGHEAMLHQSLTSLLVQSRTPDRIFVHLSREPYLFDRGFPDGWDSVQEPVRTLISENANLIEVKWVPNTGSFRKFLPLLTEKLNEDCLIVSVDEDTVYHPQLLENMIVDFEQNGGNVCVNSRGFTLKQVKGVYSYEDRDAVVTPIALHNFATGKGGILYHPSMFAKYFPVMNDPLLIARLCPTSHDIYFNLWRWANGYPVLLTTDRQWMVKDMTDKARSMFDQFNSKNGANTKQLRAMMQFLISEKFLSSQ